MTLAKIQDGEPSPEIKEAVRQESVVDTFNAAILSVNDPVQRKTVTDLLSMQTSTYYQARLRWLSDENRFIMNPLEGGLSADGSMLSENEMNYRDKKLKEFDALVVSRPYHHLDVDETSIEETIIEFCQEFSEGEIGADDFILGLKTLVVKSVEFSHLLQTGRLDRSKVSPLDIGLE